MWKVSTHAWRILDGKVSELTSDVSLAAIENLGSNCLVFVFHRGALVVYKNFLGNFLALSRWSPDGPRSHGDVGPRVTRDILIDNSWRAILFRVQLTRAERSGHLATRVNFIFIQLLGFVPSWNVSAESRSIGRRNASPRNNEKSRVKTISVPATVAWIILFSIKFELARFHTCSHWKISIKRRTRA